VAGEGGEASSSENHGVRVELSSGGGCIYQYTRAGTRFGEHLWVLSVSGGGGLKRMQWRSVGRLRCVRAAAPSGALGKRVSCGLR
jgi:hypothetical protein